jgi:hypothetical protein
VTGPDDDFGDFASAGWTASFSVDGAMSGTTDDMQINESTVIKEVGKSSVDMVSSSHPRQDVENVVRFEGKRNAETGSRDNSLEASRTDSFKFVSVVQGDGGSETPVQDGGLTMRTEFGDFSSGTWNGVAAEGSLSKEGIDHLSIDTSHFIEQSSGWQHLAPDQSSENLPEREVGASGGKGQFGGCKTSDASFGWSLGLNDGHTENTEFGQFSSSSGHITDRTINTEPSGVLENDVFGQLESSAAGKTETVNTELPLVEKEEKCTERSNMQVNNIPCVENEQKTFNSFPSQGLESPVGSTRLNNQPDSKFDDSLTQDDNFATFASSPLVKSENETDTVFGKFASSGENETDIAFGDFTSSGDGFTAFGGAPSGSSSSIVPTFQQQVDDEFGNFGSASADFGDFGDFSSSSNTVDTFGQFSSTGDSAFGVFASSPTPVPATQSQTLEHTVATTSKHPHISLDSGSVQRVLVDTFVLTHNLQSDCKQLDLQLSGQNRADWNLLKNMSNELKGRFNIKDCETHQHLLDVLHIDVHAVFSPGFGGDPLPFFGNVGWLESELSSAAAAGLSVPVANTLLDLSASPVPSAPPPGPQVAEFTQNSSVPENTGVAPSNVTADIGMLDLDFFGASPASPSSPSGEMGGGLALADLQALGLILEPSSRRSNTVASESKDPPPSSDPLAKVFALAGQSTGTWSAQNFVTGAELSPEAGAVVASLPDLSFVHSTVLMFPMQLSPIIQTTGPSDGVSSDLL